MNIKKNTFLQNHVSNREVRLTPYPQEYWCPSNEISVLRCLLDRLCFGRVFHCDYNCGVLLLMVVGCILNGTVLLLSHGFALFFYEHSSTKAPLHVKYEPLCVPFCSWGGVKVTCRKCTDIIVESKKSFNTPKLL